MILGHSVTQYGFYLTKCMKIECKDTQKITNMQIFVTFFLKICSFSIFCKINIAKEGFLYKNLRMSEKSSTFAAEKLLSQRWDRNE